MPTLAVCVALSFHLIVLHSSPTCIFILYNGKVFAIIAVTFSPSTLHCINGTSCWAPLRYLVTNSEFLLRLVKSTSRHWDLSISFFFAKPINDTLKAFQISFLLFLVLCWELQVHCQCVTFQKGGELQRFCLIIPAIWQCVDLISLEPLDDVLHSLYWPIIDSFNLLD